MSVEEAVKLIDNAAKHERPLIYRLGLLARTLRSPNDLMSQFLRQINSILICCETVPPEVRDVWLRYVDGFMLSAAATSSKNGWLMDIITQTRVKFSGQGAGGDARKYFNKNEQQQQQEQQQP